MGKLPKLVGILVHCSQKLKMITVNFKSQENLPSDLAPKASWRKAFMQAFGTAFSLKKKPPSVFLLSGVAAISDRQAQSREHNQGQRKLTPCSICHADPMGHNLKVYGSGRQGLPGSLFSGLWLMLNS